MRTPGLFIGSRDFYASDFFAILVHVVAAMTSLPDSCVVAVPNEDARKRKDASQATLALDPIKA
jgi:hypothetical protein